MSTYNQRGGRRGGGGGGNGGRKRDRGDSTPSDTKKTRLSDEEIHALINSLNRSNIDLREQLRANQATSATQQPTGPTPTQASATLTWAQRSEVEVHSDHIVTYCHLRAHDQAWVQLPRALSRKLQDWRQSIDPVDSTPELDRRLLDLADTFTTEVVAAVRQHIADRTSLHRDAIRAIPTDLATAARAEAVNALKGRRVPEEEIDRRFKELFAPLSMPTIDQE